MNGKSAEIADGREATETPEDSQPGDPDRDRDRRSGGFLLDPHEVVKVLSSSSWVAARPASADIDPDIPISIAPPFLEPQTSSVPPARPS